MGIYGDMLLAFPEQRATATIYDMEAEINAGWTRVQGSDQLISCIFQHTTGKRLQDNNGNLVQVSGLELWTETTGLNGKFTTINNVVFRLISDNDWHKEGGFVRYGLEKVVGNDGTKSDDNSWNTGNNSFG